MKRGASGELDGSLQPSEKAAKEGDAGPEPVEADPLFLFLRELSQTDAKEWLDVLHGRRVRSLDTLKGLAEDDGWDGFLKKLRNADQEVLASKLRAWKQGPAAERAPGEKRGGRFFLFFSFFFFFFFSSSSR